EVNTPEVNTPEVSTHTKLKETVTEYSVNTVKHEINIDCTKHKDSLKKLATALREVVQQMQTKYNVSNEIDERLNKQKAELEELKNVKNELDKQVTKLNNIQMSFDNIREHEWQTMMNQVEALKNDINQIVNSVQEKYCNTFDLKTQILFLIIYFLVLLNIKTSFCFFNIFLNKIDTK
ncbi:hypothetical protein RFI_10462, partial [Reticulomyxa filosa]